MAGCNAIFWTENETSEGNWDGSEEMVFYAHYTQLPENTRIPLNSWTAVKTIIVTLQALRSLVVGLGQGTFCATIALDSIFMPLAIYGLLRTLPSFWLTDHFNYIPCKNNGNCCHKDSPAKDSPKEDPETGASLLASNSEDKESDSHRKHFRPVSFFLSRIVRYFYLISVLALITITALYGFGVNLEKSTTDVAYNTPWTTTSCLLELLFGGFFFITFGIFVRYFCFCESKCEKVIIPCISSQLYKLYTCLFFLLMLLLVVIAAIETRRTSCGVFTTLPPEADGLICANA
jgi:hypothetical protein